MTLHLGPIIEGEAGGPTIVFLQGWPDDASVWDDVVAAVRADYRCVRVTLPNFDGHVSAREGHVTEEIVDAFVEVIRNAATGGPVTLVLHDWGCYWGHAAHHRVPELVARVAGLDVAPHFAPGPAAALGMVVYQSWLYAAFEVGGPLGDWMTRGVAHLFQAPAPDERIRAAMDYPYRNVWADLFSGRAKALTRGYWPTCPLLFAYGERKPFPFHSEAWTSHVRKTGGEVVALPCGHWVQKDPRFVAALRGWLGRTEA